MNRLFVVVRSDLDPGLQLAQSCHALGAFAVAHEEDFKAWMRGGQNIVCLAARDENHLKELHEAHGKGAAFYEPDLGGAMTAAAFHESAHPLLGSLPLALRDKWRMSRQAAPTLGRES